MAVSCQGPGQKVESIARTIKAKVTSGCMRCNAAVIESQEQEVVQPLPGTASPSPQQQQQQQVHQQHDDFRQKMHSMLRSASPKDSQQLQLAAEPAHAQATGPEATREQPKRLQHFWQ